LLLESGADVNVKFHDGTTLLHNLVKTRNVSNLLDLALNSGAVIGTQDRRGNTPLHTAIQLAHTKREYRGEYTSLALYMISKIERQSDLLQPNLLRKSPRDIGVKSNNQPVIQALEAQIERLSL